MSTLPKALRTCQQLCCSAPGALAIGLIHAVLQGLYVAAVNDTYTAQTQQPPYSSVSEVCSCRPLACELQSVSLTC